jgi:Zn-dependent protease with chaperone function
MIRRWISGKLPARIEALSYFVSICAAGISTGIVLALITLKFLSGSLLAAMGEACGGIFQASQGFLAASRWNYLLAVAAAAVFFLQAAFLFGGGFRLSRASGRAKRSRMKLSRNCPALTPLCGKSWSRRLFVVPGEAPEAMTVGIFRPRILLSRGLVESLPSEELRAVIEHEEAHRCGKDNLLVAVSRAVSLTLFYLPGPKMAFREMRRSLEKAADLRAAGRSGGRLVVAGALARLVSLQGQDTAGSILGSAVKGAGTAEIALRLEELVRPADRRRRSWITCSLAVVVTALVLIMSFASSALAVTGTDQKSALICFTEHAQEGADTGVCELDHPVH